MRLFSEKVKPTLTNSSLNILRVENFEEIFFGVYEIEINKNKYPVEKISEHNGNPVVSVPVEVKGKKANYPFVLTKGKLEIIFNENSDYVEIFEQSQNTQDIEEEIIQIEEDIEEIEIPNLEDKKQQILEEIQRAKKKALIASKKEIEKQRSQKIKQIREEKDLKEKALGIYLENARENLVEEFTTISQKIKKDIFDNNNERFSEISDTIDNKIQDLADSLNESLKNNFNNSSKLLDKSIKKLIKDLYEKNINPRVDDELTKIATEIVEKVSEINKNVDQKIDKKADVSLVENVNKELDAIRDSNIELNNSLNKGVQKALSRVGNVDKKIIDISEKLERKIEETEKDVIEYFDEKLILVKEETLDLTDEARRYFQNLIQESRDNLLSEIRKIKNEKPIEYVLETKNNEKIVKDWDSIEKEWNKKIHDKIESVKSDLRKYVAVYASGGGTNAVQYADGGTMNGDLIVNGDINVSQNVTSSEMITNRLSFNTTTNLPVSAGQLTWDDADGTLRLGLKGGNVSLQLGQEEIIRVVNKTDTNLLESQYKVVRVRTRDEGGAQGQRLAVVLAKADNEIDSATTLGVVTENIAKNQEGFITTFGLVRGINTTGSLQGEAWEEGDMLYLSPTVLGGLTKVKPVAPQHTVIIGYVVYVNQNEGKIFVKVDNGYELDELHNVRITNVQNNDALFYNSLSSVWVNKPIPNPDLSQYLPLSGGTVTGNLTVVGTLSTTLLEALSANVTVLDIKQYELSGFNVTGNATVQGSISASENIYKNGEIVVSSDTIHHIVSLTQAQYDSLTPDPNTFYIITDADQYGPISFPIKAVNADYTIEERDYTINITNACNLTLPTAIGCGGRLYNIKNSVTGTSTLSAALGENIDGQSNIELSTQYQSITIQSTNSNWIII